MSSSLKKVIKQKSHKERSQLTSRSKYGLLEKHKDYVLRARDYHKKQDRLTNLKRKATTRNPDEFYFAMQSAKTAKGIHLSGTETKKRLAKRFSNDELKIIREQDDKYLWMARQINRKKLEKLKEQMHLVQDDDEDDDVNKDMMKLDQDLSGSEQDQEESDDEFSKWLKEGKSDDDQHQNNASTKPKLPKHTIFVDDEKEAKTFNAAKHFNTHPSLLSNKHNRPRLATLSKQRILPTQPKSKTNAIDHEALLDSHKKAKELQLRELLSRMDRETKIEKVQDQIHVQRMLSSNKGARKKVGVDDRGVMVFKWRPERKK